MDKTNLRDGNRNFYREYYSDPNISRWRAISARYKAENVIRLWSSCGLRKPALADVGCGDGALIMTLDNVRFARSYTGIEISESGLEKAKMQKYQSPCNFILFDGCTIPFQNQSFDLAVLSHVLEHVDCPRLLLHEAARIARYIFVEVPLELNCRTPLHYKPTPVGHINLFNPLLLRQLVESSGLRIMAEQITCPGLPVFTYQQSFLRAWFHWAIKSALLKLARGTATSLFTYNGCVITEDKPK